MHSIRNPRSRQEAEPVPIAEPIAVLSAWYEVATVCPRLFALARFVARRRPERLTWLAHLARIRERSRNWPADQRGDDAAWETAVEYLDSVAAGGVRP